MGLIIAPPPSFAINKQRYQRTDSKAVRDQDGPKPPEITLKDLLGQLWIDIYGKEVQSASSDSPEGKEFFVVELSEEKTVQESKAVVETVSRKAQVRQLTL